MAKEFLRSDMVGNTKDRSNGIFDCLHELFADSDRTDSEQRKQNEKTAKRILEMSDKLEKLLLERAEKAKNESSAP